MTALHVAFTKSLSAKIRAEAERRGLHPATMVAGAISAVIEGDLLDAVFDGADPHEAAGGHARHANGLTHYQCAVLYLAAQHADRQGVCWMSADKFALLIKGGSRQGMLGVLRWLVATGHLKRVQKATANGVQPHRLTRRGEELAASLGSFGEN